MSRQNFIAPETLSALLADGADDLRIVDASWYLPSLKRNGAEEYLERRIPQAQYFDIKKISDQNNPLPHMLPSAADFGEAVGKMGVSTADHIVIYDGRGIFSAARAWWMFKIMGAVNVQVLEGGFDRWQLGEFPVETGAPARVEPSVFLARLDAGKVCHIADIRANIKSQKSLILDARPQVRFSGEAKEFRAGLNSGHMPGAKSLPIATIQSDGRLRDTHELSTIFEKLGVDNDTHIITTCGSGVTAAIITMALETIGHTNNSLYDGSWSEWGQAENAPYVTGA